MFGKVSPRHRRCALDCVVSYCCICRGCHFPNTEEGLSRRDRYKIFLGRGTDLISNTEGNTQSCDNHALMSWKDLSCRYPSRKLGCADIMTLSEATGEIRYKELVAIMVSDTCDMFLLVSLNVSQMELLPYLYFYQFSTNWLKRRGEMDIICSAKPASAGPHHLRAQLALHWTHDSVSTAQSRCNFSVGSLSLMLMLTVDGHTCG